MTSRSLFCKLMKEDLKQRLWSVILAAIVFLIIPIPTAFLDVLMALNISIALIILFNALFSQEVLNMSTFPMILLFTTILLLATNILLDIVYKMLDPRIEFD